MADDTTTFNSSEAHKDQSAGTFLAEMATQIQGWLRDNTFSGADKGMQWLLTATLPDGTKLLANQLSAHGHAMVKVSGELPDGRPALLICNVHAVQFLASYIQRAKPEQPKKREIGFHTGIGNPITIEQ
ncbi:MAG TPA: hypothetical protein VLT36_23360 [Candidatus Dormibacteraeota bacterium]|nr:hypothetical protein [Candidatus Dormibacteraeota bacterium]